MKNLGQLVLVAGAALQMPDILEPAGHGVAGAVVETLRVNTRRYELGINAAGGEDRPASRRQGADGVVIGLGPELGAGEYTAMKHGADMGEFVALVDRPPREVFR